MKPSLGHAQILDLIQKQRVALSRVQIDYHIDFDLIEQRRVLFVRIFDGAQHVAAILDVGDLAHQNFVGEVGVLVLVVEQALQVDERLRVVVDVEDVSPLVELDDFDEYGRYFWPQVDLTWRRRRCLMLTLLFLWCQRSTRFVLYSHAQTKTAARMVVDHCGLNRRVF